MNEENSEKKRVRINYTKGQLQDLELIFSSQPYPDMLMRENIAYKLNLTTKNVHVSSFLNLIYYYYYYYYTFM